MPKFNSISISGYHMQEGELLKFKNCLLIADGIEYVKAAMNKGLKVDEFAHDYRFFLE